MTELRPLLECSDDELERSLLQSVRADMPAGLGLRATALAVGLAAPTADALAASLAAAGALSHAGLQATSTVAASTVATPTVTAPVGAAGALGAASLGIVGKSLVAGALVSFLALTTLDHSLRSSAPQALATARTASSVLVGPAPPALPRVSNIPTPHDLPSSPAVAPSVAPPSAPGSGRQSAARVAPSEPPLQPNAAPTNAAFSLPPRPEPPLPATSTNASLAAEIQLLDQVRAALAQGNSAWAGQLLDRYAANRPSAVLAQEAGLLRVQLLLSRGQRRQAAELSRRILHQHPESAHVDWLRALAGEP